MKYCTSILYEGPNPLDLSLFTKDRSRKDGYHSRCKECNKKHTSKWYKENKSDILNRSKLSYYSDHDRNKSKAAILSQNYKKQRGLTWTLFMSIKTRAKKKNMLFNLLETDLIIPNVCPILGTPLTQKVGPRTNNYPTVDRINNNKGYTKDNIQIISWRANRLKGTATIAELILLGN